MIYSLLVVTRISMHTSSLIDNIFVSDPSKFLSGLIRLDISDHLTIFDVLKSSNQCVVKDNMNVVTRVVIKIRIDKLTQYLSSVTWDFMINTSCINDDYDRFINTVVTSVNK